jgi:hypothetical protein
MADKKQLEAFTSPIGEAIYPWISKADTKHDAAGVFHTDLSVPFEAADAFIAKLEKVRNDFKATLPVNKQGALTDKPVYEQEYSRPVYKEGMAPEEKAAVKSAHVPELTGNVLFRFKLKNNVTTGAGETFTQTPIVVNAADGEKVEGPVYMGSIIRVRGQIVPYTNSMSGVVGITLRMKAVQVIEQVGGSGGGSSFWTDGFNDEEAA